MSSHQDTDSSNDSIENHFFSNVTPNAPNMSIPKNDRVKWDNNSQQFSWNENPNKWEKKPNHWAITGTDDPQKWSALENRDDNLYEIIDKSANTFPPPPSKPDSPEVIKLFYILVKIQIYL
jgi:hypothetical protein